MQSRWKCSVILVVIGGLALPDMKPPLECKSELLHSESVGWRCRERESERERERDRDKNHVNVFSQACMGSRSPPQGPTTGAHLSVRGPRQTPLPRSEVKVEGEREREREREREKVPVVTECFAPQPTSAAGNGVLALVLILASGEQEGPETT